MRGRPLARESNLNSALITRRWPISPLVYTPPPREPILSARFSNDRAGGLSRAHHLGPLPIALSLAERFVGLIGKNESHELTLLIPRCSQVHTWFMRTPIDLVFLDDDGHVLSFCEAAPKWGTYTGPRGTRSVLELPPGRLRAIELAVGDRLSWEPSGVARIADGQRAEVMSRFAEPLRVVIADMHGRPRAATAVSFSLIPGRNGASATFGGEPRVRTNSRGVATAPPLNANGIAGTFHVHASAGRRSTTFELFNTPSAAASIEAVVDGRSEFSDRLSAIVRDAHGNAVPEVAVQFEPIRGQYGACGTFRGSPTVVTDANGIAVAPPLIANRRKGPFSVIARAAGAGSVTFALSNHDRVAEKRSLGWAALIALPFAIAMWVARKK